MTGCKSGGAPHRGRDSFIEYRGCPHLIVVSIVCLGETIGIAAAIVDFLAILVDHVMAPAGRLVTVVMQLHPVNQPALFRCWRRRLLFVRRPLQERGAPSVGLRLLFSVHPAEGNVHSAAFQVVVDHQQVAQQLQAHLARVLVDLDAVAFWIAARGDRARMRAARRLFRVGKGAGPIRIAIDGDAAVCVGGQLQRVVAVVPVAVPRLWRRRGSAWLHLQAGLCNPTSTAASLVGIEHADIRIATLRRQDGIVLDHIGASLACGLALVRTAIGVLEQIQARRDDLAE